MKKSRHTPHYAILIIVFVCVIAMAALVAFLFNSKPHEYGGCFTSIVFSKDGSRMLARVGGGNVMMLWDVDTGREIRTIKGVGADQIAFGPEGHTAVTGGGNAQNILVVLWDLDTGQPLHVFEGPPLNRPPLSATCVDFSADRKYLLSADSEQSIVLWDAHTFEQVRAFQAAGIAPDRIYSIKFSPDGRLAVSAGDRLILWDVQTGRMVRVIKEYKQDAHAIYNMAVFIGDGRMVASGGRDKTITIWSVETGEPHKTIDLDYIPKAVSFSPDGRLVLVERTFPRGSLEIWDLEQKALSQTVEPSAGSPGTNELSFAMTPDSQKVALGMCGKIELMDIKTGETVYTFKPDRSLFRILMDAVYKYIKI
jgi:WD40 repeat protein